MGMFWVPHPNNGFEYMVSHVKMTRDSHEAFAKELHGHLVSITTESERTFVHSLVIYSFPFWTGLKSKGGKYMGWDENWKWSDGSRFTGSPDVFHRHHVKAWAPYTSLP